MTEKKRRILVVDDEQTVRYFLQRTLEKAGYDVITASNGLEALEKMSQFDISLVLLDIMMPGLDGFEVLDHMRQYEKNIPVIMLTGIQEATTKVDSLTLGADDYITKPFSVEELLARIQVKLKRAKPTS
ncbi:Alkaline phosphatase synthesis transcriptional regulatory protein PhoP [subsurface metagenome]|nr:response regulator [Dehalococcoidia bacterium]